MHKICRILDDKYKKAYLNTVVDKQCQHINSSEGCRLLTLFRKFEDMFGVTLGMCNTTPVDMELKYYKYPVCSQSCPVPTIHEAMFKRKQKDL